MKNEITLNLIEKVFDKRTPKAVGVNSYYSVLVPLVEKEDGLYLLYEKRAEHMKRQPGEVCFPGGKVEPDESFEECAVRETVEELGIQESDIRVIRQMDVLITHNNFIMFPFLGIIEEEALERLDCNPDEVHEVFLVPVTHLLEHDPYLYKMQVIPQIPEDFPYEKIKFPKGYKWRKGVSEVPIYEYENRVIWGLTGRITMNLMKVLKEEADV